MKRLLFCLILLSATAAHAQFFAQNFSSSPIRVATGDARAVTEPAFPTTICGTVTATKYLISTNAFNLDSFAIGCGSTGGTLGTLYCTGGSSYEPSSTTPGFTTDESLDTTAFTSLFAGCSPGQAIEVVAGASGQRALVVGKISWPTGMNVILDAGIHVDASADPADYGGTGCGTVAPGTSQCNPLFTAANTTGVGFYGYGVFDGRGWHAFPGSSTASWYTNRIQAYGNANGGPSHGSPNLTPDGRGGISFGPTMFNLLDAQNVTFYKITIKDSGDFAIQWKGLAAQVANGLFWGVKVHNPFEVLNTDGIDPVNFTNASILYSFLSSGDNAIAAKAEAFASSNLTVRHNMFGAAIGAVIGADTTAGLSNALFADNVYNGNSFNDLDEGFGIGTNSTYGNTVNTVTWRNECMMNEPKAMRFYTTYNGSTGLLPPTLSNILIQHVHVLASTVPYTTGHSGTFTFQGYGLSNLLTGQIDDLAIDGIYDGVKSQGSATTNQYGTIYAGPGPVASSVFSALASPPGTSISTVGNGTPVTPYPCTVASYVPLSTELNLNRKTLGLHNNQSFSGSPPYTLEAVIEPVNSISTKQDSQPNGSVVFKDNGSTIATVALGAINTAGDIASWAVNSASSGTHVYTATYTGDSTYADVTFGSITVVVP